MVRLGCLLIVLAMVGLCVLIVIPVLPPFATNETIDGLLRPLMCQEGESIQRDQYTAPGSRGGVSFSMNVYCIDQNGNRRDETGRWTLIGAGAFAIPFLLGLFGVIFGASRSARAATAATAGSLSIEIGGQNLSGFTPTGSGKSPSLTERLREIQEARDAGLITTDEYERLRKEALDSLS